MKTLKDFYIVVTEKNHEQIKELLPNYNYGLNKTIYFNFDDVNSYSLRDRYNVERISLSKLKRYIDNTPTREGLKKAQNASKMYKYKYEQCKRDNEEKSYYIEEFRIELKELEKERDKWKGLHYDSSTNLDFANEDIGELKHSNERLQYNLDNLRSEREQLTNLAKKDVNLCNKTLVEWVEYIQENNKYMYKECTVLGISNKNLELNNTKLNKENDNLNKELRKYKTVAMCSLLLTLLALGLWF